MGAYGPRRAGRFVRSFRIGVEADGGGGAGFTCSDFSSPRRIAGEERDVRGVIGSGFCGGSVGGKGQD